MKHGDQIEVCGVGYYVVMMAGAYNEPSFTTMSLDRYFSGHFLLTEKGATKGNKLFTFKYL